MSDERIQFSQYDTQMFNNITFHHYGAEFYSVLFLINNCLNE